MNHVRVKICGLTRAEDVIAAVSAGADAIGFVFADSPRRIGTETAAQLAGYVPEEVLRVGLFMDQDLQQIQQVVNAVPLDVLQFHGSEPESVCKSFGLPYLKAVVMDDVESAKQAERDYPTTMGLVLDSHRYGKPGGSGKVFDWSLAGAVSKPVWLAGGLNAGNVAAAIRAVRPYAVDVSSGVESKPGIKDADRINAFIKASKAVENDQLDNGLR